VHDPTHKLALATLLALHQKEVMPADDSEKIDWHNLLAHDMVAQTATERLPEFWKALPQLKKLPLYSLVAKLIQQLGLATPANLPALHAFQSTVHHFCRQADSTLYHFLNWWHKEGQELALPMPQAPHSMPIMTVHQAKGLAFEAVVLPFCGWRLDHSIHHPPVQWCQTAQPPFAQLKQVPLYYGSKLKETYYNGAYFEEKWQQHLEQLNLLYVAFTRPKTYLYAFAPQEKSETLRTAAHLLGAGIASCSTKWGKEAVWYKDEVSQLQTCTLGEAPPSPRNYVQPISTQIANPNLSASSKLVPHELNPLLAALQPPPHRAGNWWHDLLAEITYADQLPAVLARYVKRGDLTIKEAAYYTQKITAWWKNPQLKEWFSSVWEIKKEATILVRGRVIRPDRVMLQKGKAVVLDFKSGQSHQGKQAEHAQQVTAYANYLQRMGYTSVAAYLFYLEQEGGAALQAVELV